MFYNYQSILKIEVPYHMIWQMRFVIQITTSCPIYNLQKFSRALKFVLNRYPFSKVKWKEIPNVLNMHKLNTKPIILLQHQFEKYLLLMQIKTESLIILHQINVQCKQMELVIKIWLLIYLLSFINKVASVCYITTSSWYQKYSMCTTEEAHISY